MSGLSHVSIGVNDLERAKAFYDPLMRSPVAPPNVGVAAVT
jgi:predicted enzyme related to lactoylglutathione lyase